MIIPYTYHVHTSFSDGKATPKQMILSAIEAGCAEIGISDHSYLIDADWTMPLSKTPEYVSEIRELSDKYSEKIKVFLGIELDVYSDICTEGFDYVIGSVHRVAIDGVWRDVDTSAEYTRETVEKYFGGDPYAYCEAYYAEVEKIYEKTRCDVIGHFDLVTKFIERDGLFSEEHPRYIAARDKALFALLKTPALFELNTGAMARGYRTSPYPHADVIRRIAEAGKSLVIASDSHTPSTVVYGFEKALKMLEKMGASYTKSLSEILSVTRK